MWIDFLLEWFIDLCKDDRYELQIRFVISHKSLSLSSFLLAVHRFGVLDLTTLKYKRFKGISLKERR